jgi:hypothetical protein
VTSGSSLKLTRRIALGAGAAGVGGWLMMRDPSIKDEIDRILEKHFGKTIAASDAARAFRADALDRFAAGDARRTVAKLERRGLEEQVVLAFLQSTTYQSHAQKGAGFHYLGMFDPYKSPCISRLVAPI